MESYVRIDLQSSQRIEGIRNAFEKLEAFDISGCKEDLAFLGDDVLRHLDFIVEEYGECLEGIEEFGVEGHKLHANFVCGGEGLDFLFQLFVLFGPGVDSISATFDHDEETDESDFSTIAYLDGKLYINEKEVFDETVEQKNVFDYINDELIGTLGAHSEYVLLITSTPEGEAPRWVRDQWVGLKIPLTVGAVSGDLELAENPTEPQHGESASEEFDSPLVMALDAFEVLKRKSYDAWEWWNQNCPELFDTDAAFTFNSGSWEVIPE